MVKRLSILLLVVLLFASTLLPALADDQNTNYNNYIIDNINLLSKNEKNNLAKYIKKIDEKYSIPVILYISNDIDAKSAKNILTDIWTSDTYHFDENHTSIFIAYNKKQAKLFIKKQGLAKQYNNIHNSDILDIVYKYSAQKEYYRMYIQILQYIVDNIANSNVVATKNQYKSIDFNRYIIDDANLLSTQSKNLLAKQIKDVASKHNIALALATSSTVPSGKWQQYADDLYDYGNYGFDSQKSGALLLIDMHNRKLHISTTGRMIDIINDSREEAIFDIISSNASNKQYYKVFSSFIDECNHYINIGISKGTYRYDDTNSSANTKSNYNIISDTDIYLALGLGLFVIIMYYLSVYRRYSFKTRQYQYNIFDNTDINLSVKNDTYLRRDVHRRYIPPSNSHGGGSGGSGVHFGSSGTSHGGGSRGF